MGKHTETMCCHWQILFGCALFALIPQVHGQSSDGVPLTLVDGAIEKNAVCLDGTPAGYHFDPGFGDGVNNWMVHLMGGGWCVPYTCYLRLGKFHGSTNNIELMNFGGMLSSNQTTNPDFYNWNRVFVRYCDGASFLGDTEQDDNGHNVQLRGSRIFSAVMDELLQKGMQKADNAILAGGSAGALATILNCDGFRALLPNSNKVKCVSDSGFFIRAKDLPHADFRERVFAHTIEFHNLTNILPTSCTSKMNASLCLFPEYLLGDIQTPLFILNTAFDSYQIQVGLKPNDPDLTDWSTTCVNDTSNDLPLPRPSTCTAPQMQLIKDYRGAFLDAINGLVDVPSRGIYINACYSHVFSMANDLWTETPCKLENKTISQAVGDWFFDRSPIKLIDSKTDVPLNCDATKYGNL